ncbi:MAG: metallophosphoesterase [Roseiflexaceae bacterium]|nr:metallophosphoesterase [Roseiflexaceae bacterium]
MHVSDLHAGWPFNPDLARLLAADAHALQPDLLVVSGDLVQRADFPHQWQVIKAYLRQLPGPQLIVPGNHDVPLLNVFDRLFRPYRQFTRHISSEINPVFELPGLAVVGGCTAHGWTVDGGRLSRDQIAKLEGIFRRYPSGTCKIAVLHHHVIDPPGSQPGRIISNADDVVDLFDRCGVEVLMCGHIHVSYIGSTLDGRPDLERGTIICQSGTTTSTRGKGREAGKNSYNVIEIDDTTIRITQQLFLENAGRFVPVAQHIYPRRSAGVYALPEPSAIDDRR